MSLVGKFATVGSATLGSRILGFVRETLMAAALGAGPMADAFYAAFRFPNLFRRLFAEGAFNAAFVPLFAKEIEAGGERGRAPLLRRGVRRPLHGAARPDDRHGTRHAAAGRDDHRAGLRRSRASST